MKKSELALKIAKKISKGNNKKSKVYKDLGGGWKKKAGGA